MTTPTLSLCFICKNEEKNIGNMLESVKGPLFDEIIAVDSVPGYVPVIIRNIKTREIDIISLKDLFDLIKSPIKLTLKGEEIKDIEDFEVWVRYRKCRNSNSWTKINYILRHKYIGEICRINTMDSLIDVTPNHSLFNANGKTIDASKIEVGKNILVGELKNCHKTGRGLENKFFCGSEDLSWLFGFFAAEGSACIIEEENKTTYLVKISNKNITLLNFCKKVLKKDLNIHSYINHEKETGMYQLVCAGKLIYNYFRKLFYTSDSEKKVPREIFNSPDNIRSKFLEGCYAGDGHFYDSGEKSYTSKSWNLIQGVLWLLYSLSEQSHSIQIRDDKPNIINIKTNRKKERKSNFNIVKKIKKYHYEGYVYDLSTELEKFQAGVGQIFAHNTGSKDSTVDIIKKYTDKIYHFHWINDFSAARNFSFSKATCTQIFWIDSDDVIRPEDYKKLLELKPKLNDFDIWLLKYEYAHDEFGNSICSFYRERIVRRSLNLQWQQPIHEYLPLLGTMQKTDIEIHHFKNHNSSARNIPMLEKIVKKDPNNSRNIFYLGKELFDNGQIEDAKKHLLKFVNMPDGWSENKYAAYLKLANCAQIEKNFQEAKNFCLEAIKLDPLKAEVYCKLGEISFDENNLLNAIHWYLIASNMSRPEHTLDMIEPKYYTWLPHLQLCVAYNNIGKIKEAAIHNEISYNYLSQDPRIANNRKIFKESMGETFIFDKIKVLKNIYEIYDRATDISPVIQEALVEALKELNKEELKVIEDYRFNKKIGWCVPADYNAGTIRIRTLNICKQLQLEGYASDLCDYESASNYDIIVVGKNFSEIDLNYVKKWLSENKKVVCDLSEDILEFEMVKQLVKLSDLVVCCSEELSIKVFPINKNVIVIEDAVEFYNEVDIEDKKEIKDLKVFWYGYGGHSWMAEKLRSIIEDDLGMKLITIHEHPNADIPWKLETVYQELSKADIIIAPSNFKRQPCKSNNRVTQAMALKKPIICDPLPAYKKVVENGLNGFICTSGLEPEWCRYLVKLRDDAGLRKRISRNAFETSKKYSVEIMSKKWIEALSKFDKVEEVVQNETIDVIIPTRDNRDILEECLKSFTNSSLLEEIYIIDNGDDNSVEEVLKKNNFTYEIKKV